MAGDKVKCYSAPLPFRAIGDHRLAGLDLRVLAGIAAHDRMSLAREKGAGCWAKHETLAAEVGCNYQNLGKSIKRLTEFGYLVSERPPNDRREHIYRIPAALYGLEESRSYYQPSPDARKRVSERDGLKVVGQTTDEPPEMVGHDPSENPAETSTSVGQYISCNDERYSVETDEKYSCEHAHLAARASSLVPNGGEAQEEEGALQDGEGTNLGGALARLERALKAGVPGIDYLGWLEWIERFVQEDEDEKLRGWAVRLSEMILDQMPEADYDAWAKGHGLEVDAPATPQPAQMVAQVVDEPADDTPLVDTLQLQTAAFWESVNPAGRAQLAKAVGVSKYRLREFVEGQGFLDITQRRALGSALKKEAA